ncbi:MAG: glycosyltransferase, partial [Chloroflexota bacterium]
NGSRGDVQPYLALGVGLQKAGYAVKLASATMYESWIRGYGLDFGPISINPQKLIEHPDFKKYRDNAFRLFLAMPKLIGPLFAKLMDDMWTESQGADIIIMTPIFYGAYSSAEKLGVPTLIAFPFPVYPTNEFPNFSIPSDRSFGKAINRFGGIPIEILLNFMIGRPMKKWRKNKLGLPPFPFGGPMASMRKQKIPILGAYSPHFIPPPKDWPSHCHTTGYWFLDAPEGWEAPNDLIEFLALTPKPLSIGFGSMHATKPEKTIKIVLEALEMTKQRAVLITEEKNLGEIKLPESVYQIDNVPHDWLFPRVSAVIHHGGAGTTGAGLRAGVPSILIPFGVDQ